MRSFLPTMYQPGFDFQSGSSGFRYVEQVGVWEHCTALPKRASSPARTKSPAKSVDAFRKQPDASVLDVDVGEDRCLREIGLLCLRRLVRVRSKRADVNQPGNAIVGSGAGDDGSAVGVADKDNRAADPTDRCFR